MVVRGSLAKAIIQRQAEEIESLKDEVSTLKQERQIAVAGEAPEEMILP